MSTYSFDLFLSYANQDVAFARQMVAWLRHCGFAVWIDEEQLVPGSRFRVGLQQGLRESRHMVVLLTDGYTNRPWTQRELDLFDLDADHTEQRLLALQIGEMRDGPLDQVFLVHQRIPWNKSPFDPEAFWKLHCGLTGSRPGPREKWEESGKTLIESKKPIGSQSGPLQQRQPTPHLSDVAGRPSPTLDLIELIRQTLTTDHWADSFSRIREVIRSIPSHEVVHDLIMMPWASGSAETAGLIALAMLPEKHPEYSAWPFVDLSCDEVADWFLTWYSMVPTNGSEIWFSWTVCQQWWDLLPQAAAKAPTDGLADHFGFLARLAADKTESFKSVEENYDYGVMITPWNHFHLTWLAARLGDPKASMAHASRLCSTTTLGDLRTGRFLNRLTTWRIFSEHRRSANLMQQLSNARQTLGILAPNSIEPVKERLTEIWRSTLQDAG